MIAAKQCVSAKKSVGALEVARDITYIATGNRTSRHSDLRCTVMSLECEEQDKMDEARLSGQYS